MATPTGKVKDSVEWADLHQINQHSRESLMSLVQSNNEKAVEALITTEDIKNQELKT